MIYLDYAATTPMHEHALEAYQQTARKFYGNTHSLHDIGSQAEQVVSYSRGIFANLLGVAKQSVQFTSGGTAANQLAIQALLQTKKNNVKHIITTPFEHPSITSYLDRLSQQEGYQISYLAVNPFGEVNLANLQSLIRPDTCLVIVQHVNPEIGTIQPISAIGAWLQTEGILFHSDGVQAFGKIPTAIQKLHVDSYAIASHKIYGPKGVGAVYLNPNISKQSNTNVESGTSDVPAISAFATAASIASQEREAEFERLAALRSFFIHEQSKRKLPIRVLTSPNQLPHIIGIIFNEITGDYAMLCFNQAGICVSTGSACSVANQEAARTIAALDVPEEIIKNYIRLSLGTATTKEQLVRTLQVCENIINQWCR